MWLITSLLAAIIAISLCFLLKNKYKLGFLSLMLWGAVIMILVDHILGYEGGAFLEARTDGLIENGTTLGLLMLIPVFFAWIIAVFSQKFKNSQNNTLT